MTLEEAQSLLEGSGCWLTIYSKPERISGKDAGGVFRLWGGNGRFGETLITSLTSERIEEWLKADKDRREALLKTAELDHDIRMREVKLLADHAELKELRAMRDRLSAPLVPALQDSPPSAPPAE